MTKLYTIGFTEKSAEEFFRLLTEAGVKKIIDTRRNNKGQLSGFAKGSDLEFLAREIGGIGYEHNQDMAPSKELLKAWRNKEIDWVQYTERYLKEIGERKVVEKTTLKYLKNGCLLCSEHEEGHCHRRLLAEKLKGKYPKIEIVHLK